MLVGRGGRRTVARRRLVAAGGRIVGAGLVWWSGDAHWRLWRDVGYRYIPIIGPLFVVQVVMASVLGGLVLAWWRRWTALAGAAFALGTLAGFVISVVHGLFGFRDVWSSPYAVECAVLESAAAVMLVTSAVATPRRRRGRTSSPGSGRG
ncbi:MAG: hypothetical protein ACP5PB_07505 [Acidimicrobiales bacterium]